MIIIDNDKVAVETSAELKTILEGNNEYTTVYLANDITLASGITILNTKTSLAIDGTYNEIRHIFTDMMSSSPTDTIGIRAASSINLTIQNINIVGRNYYGSFFIHNSTNVSNVILSYINVNYSGPQMTYNAYSLTRYIDCNITISQNYSAAQEMAEVDQVEFYGKNTIIHNSPSDSVLWFRDGSLSPYLKIMEDASLSVSTTRDFYYSSLGAVPVTISKNASLILNVISSVMRDSSHSFGDFLIDEGATFEVIQTGSSRSSALINCSGNFTVNENAKIYIESNFNNISPLINFASSGKTITINNPKSFVLYNKNYNALSFTSSTLLNVKTNQINYWAVASSLSIAGTLSDIPLYSWLKVNTTDINLTATVTNLLTIINTNNFSAEDLLKIPALTLLQFQTARVLSFGKLLLNVDRISAGDTLITGTTSADANISVTYNLINLKSNSDEEGNISVNLSIPVSLGTIVIITSNMPFLYYTKTEVVIDLGELTFEVEEEIRFIPEVVINDPIILGREDVDFTITVTDTRLESTAWYMYASIDRPLSTDDGNYLLPEALIFIDENNAMHTLSSVPTLIHTGASYDGITKIKWPKTKGILVNITNNSLHNKKAYKSKITWILTV